mgnify:CR=1 FL=1
MENHDQKRDQPQSEALKRKGLMRLTDPDVAPTVRGVIVLIILFKVLTVNSLKSNQSTFMYYLDGVASFALIISLLLLGMLMWRKHGEPRMRR